MQVLEGIFCYHVVGCAVITSEGKYSCFCRSLLRGSQLTIGGPHTTDIKTPTNCSWIGVCTHAHDECTQQKHTYGIHTHTPRRMPPPTGIIVFLLRRAPLSCDWAPDEKTIIKREKLFVGKKKEGVRDKTGWRRRGRLDAIKLHEASKPSRVAGRKRLGCAFI